MQARARSFWWLNPCWVFALIALLPALTAYQMSESGYLLNWKSQKYFDGAMLSLVVQAVGCFLLCGFYTLVVSSRSRRIVAEPLVHPAAVTFLRHFFRFSAWLTLGGYVIWFGLAAAKGLSLSLVWAALRGDPGATYTIREMMETIPGLTTCTQFGMATFTIGAFLGVRIGWKPVLRMLILIGLLSALRAILRGERLAFIEVLIPGLVVLARMRLFSLPNGRMRWLLRFAPVLLVVALYVAFTATEYSRSWTAYYADREDSLAWFGWMRLVGYYVTALNNGAAFYANVDLPFPDSTIEWFWKFPGVGLFVDYQSVTGFDPYDQFNAVMLEDVNPEFNNISGLLIVFSDYHYIGGLIVWGAVGMMSVYLYLNFVRGGLIGLLLYPLYFVGILEAPRIFYWGSSRAFPSWLMLFFALGILLWRQRVRFHRTRLLELKNETTQTHHQTHS